ncbi:MAG TPA: ATP-binding protein [Candidatus Sulfotelmatobacter sp.]
MPYVDITPDTDVLESDRSKNIPMDWAMAELFDNSFDKLAKLISVTSGSDFIEITDDGDGVNDLQAMITRGRRVATAQKRLGRHAVGLKNTATWMSGAMIIDTRHANMRKTAEVNWFAIQASHSWRIFLPEPRVEHGDSFTAIRFADLFKGRLKAYESVVTRRKLGHIYRPALLQGRKIMLDGVELQPSRMPHFQNKPRKFEDYFDGKHFRLTIGIRAEDDTSKLTGIDVAYLYRIITASDTSGFDRYAAQRVYGYLELLTDGEDWSLPDYKNDFFEREDLYDYIFPRIEDLLQEAATAERHVEIEGSKQTVISRLQPLAKVEGDAPKKDQEVKNPRGPYGPRGPNSNPTPKPRARTLESRLAGVGFDISFDLHDENKVGEVSYRKRNTLCLISLNTDFNVVEPDNEEAIIALCCALLVMDFTKRAAEEDPNERFDFGDFDPRNPNYLVEAMSSQLRKVLPRDKDARAAVDAA